MTNKLSKLIKQQNKDQNSKYVSKDVRERNYEYHALIKLADGLSFMRGRAWIR